MEDSDEILRKRVSSLIIALIMALFITGIPAQADSWPSFSTSKPIKAYTISTGNNTTVYTSSSLKIKTGTIYASDELHILTIGKNSSGTQYARCTYPTSKGSKEAYIPLSVITKVAAPKSSGIAKASITVYRHSGSNTPLGTIAKNDKVFYLTSSGSRTQVIYNTGSVSNSIGWKMGWISTSNYNKYVGGSSTIKSYNPQGYFDGVGSNSAGTISVEGWCFDRDNLNSKLTVHVYVGGPAGSNAPVYEITANTYRKDVNTAFPGVGNYHGFSSTIKVVKTGNQTVYVYAINVGSGTNVFIGQKTLTIKGNTSGDSSTGVTINGVNIGYKAGEYFADNGKACTDHAKSGIHSYSNESACNCICTYNSKSLGSTQCMGFARYIQSKSYGVNSYSNPSQFYKLSNSYVRAGKLTASNLKIIIKSAKVGAHIRTNEGGNTYGHSMIITDITDSGFSIVQCNGSNNKEYSGHSACRIGTYTYTWSSYINSTYGKRGIEYVEMKK